jgi:proline dehydrogenase
MLSRLVPAPMVRFFAAPYVAGESVEEALDVAARLLERKNVLTTLDLLGESVTDEAQVDSNVEIYEELIRAIARDDRFSTAKSRPTVSLKPSAFTTGEQRRVIEPIQRIADTARRSNVALTIDMEDRRWTDLTLELAVDLFQRGFDVGTVLQTRLNRTESDLARIPPGMRIRLVIGIYPEPPEAAISDKQEMKLRMIEYAKVLLAKNVFVEFGTHDEPCIERFAREVAPLAPERCEVQMLLGVPRSTLQDRLQSGEAGPKLPVRLYVPFAIGWKDATAYLRRRMDESPSMVWLVLRNLWDRDR